MTFVPDAIIRYCRYQERCHQEVTQRLAQDGYYGDEAQEIVAELITNDLLNESRFATAFAGGKYRMLQWGKVKITAELRARNISPYNIKAALHQIDDDSYRHTLITLLHKKHQTLNNEKNSMVAKQKLMRYLQQKGYETTLISEAIAAEINETGKPHY
jgi:regulatory protein